MIGTGFRACLLLLLLGLSGCKEQKEVAPNAEETTPQPASGAAAPGALPASASPPIARSADVEAAVAAWVLAQNHGDFAAYSRHYAEKFTGIKRAGDRVERYGRTSWLEDRANMFKRPFTVTTSGLVVQFAPGLAMATFTQNWKSASFEDEGGKQLLFIKQGGALRISREEMLSSERKQPRARAALPFEQAAIARATRRSHALLLPHKVDLEWSVGHPSYVSDERAERVVSLKALPAKLRALLSERYEIFSTSGSRCETTARLFKILVDVVPHFGTVNLWEDAHAKEQGRSPNKVPPSGRALDLWRMATDLYQTDNASPGLTLGLELEPHPECPQPVWGRVVRANAPAPWQVRPVTIQEQRQLDLAISAHPVVRGYDAVARKELGPAPSGRWLAGGIPEASVSLTSGSGAVFFFAGARGHGGCGSVNPESAWLLFRRQAGKLVADGPPLPEPIAAAVDLTGDGEPELITSRGILSRGAGGFEHLVRHPVLFLDCSC